MMLFLLLMLMLMLLLFLECSEALEKGERHRDAPFQPNSFFLMLSLMLFPVFLKVKGAGFLFNAVAERVRAGDGSFVLFRVSIPEKEFIISIYILLKASIFTLLWIN